MPELKKRPWKLSNCHQLPHFTAEKTVTIMLRAIQGHKASINSTAGIRNQISDCNFSIFLPYCQYIFLVYL